MATQKAKKPALRNRSGARARAKAAPKPKLECRVCGYRVIVDEACGCAEEHVLICCGQPMTRK